MPFSKLSSRFQFILFFLLNIFLLITINVFFIVYQLKSLGAWEKVTRSTGFHIRDSSGEIVDSDKAFILGGYTYGENLNDYFVTKDFSNWVSMGELPCERNTTHPLIWRYHSEFYMSCTNGSVFKTENFKEWRFFDRDPPWSSYWGTCVAQFNDKILVVSGYGFQSKKNAELFTSKDGVNWTKEELEGVSVRECHSGFFVFKGQLFLIGGRSHLNRWQGLDEIKNLMMT